MEFTSHSVIHSSISIGRMSGYDSIFLIDINIPLNPLFYFDFYLQL